MWRRQKFNDGLVSKLEKCINAFVPLQIGYVDFYNYPLSPPPVIKLDQPLRKNALAIVGQFT